MSLDMGYPHRKKTSLVKGILGKGNSPKGTQLSAFRSQHQAAERKRASFVKRDPVEHHSIHSNY